MSEATTSTSVQRSSRSLLIDLALVLVLCLFSIWPLLQNPGLPNGTDTLYHIYRVAEMDRTWAQGVLMPDWAQSFYYGYGSPLFHYYASLTYYITSILARVFSMGALDSLRLLIVLCNLLAGGSMYLFLRERISPLAGFIAAVAYVYSPYLIYKEPYARGDFPELLAFALFPLVMWLFERLLRRGGVLNFVLAALAMLLLVNAHNLMAIVLTGLLGVWLVWNVLLHDVRRVAFAICALIAGVLLAAYFWLPVILQRDAVQLANLTVLAELDYRNYFLSLRQLFEPVPRLDAGAINGLLPLQNIGVAQWGLALVGIISGSVVALRFQIRQRVILTTLVFFALMAAVMIFLITPYAEAIWTIVRPLAILQFPWRFLGPVAFCLSVLVGLNAVWIERLPRSISAALTALFVLAPIALALPLFYVPEWTNTAVDSSVVGYQEAELSGLQMATTYSSEFLPVTVQNLPSPTQRLLDEYAEGGLVDRINRDALPEGVTAEAVDSGPQVSEWQVQADHAFTMEVLTFYFEGWQARVDGQPVPVYPSDPHGLITFDVPAGEHEVVVQKVASPAQQLGRGVSAFALLGVIGVLIFGWRRGRLAGNLDAATVPKSTPAQYQWALVGAGVIQLGLMMIFLQEGGAWLNSPPGEVLVAENSVDYQLGESIELLGYDLDSDHLRPGERVELTLYWYASAPIPYGYRSFVHISTGGPPLAQADKINPAGLPTVTWTPDGYLVDRYVIELPGDMPLGEYQIRVGLYTCDTLPVGECGNGDRLPITDADGQEIGDSLVLKSLTIQ